MALTGFNAVLAPIGQEYVWRRVYANLGVDISRFLTGPAFLPWWRMGNLRRLGGPLTNGYLRRQRQLQHQILRHLRRLGMIPITPFFNGIVPKELIEKFPHLKHTRLRHWGHFEEDKYSGQYLLDFLSEPLAHHLAQDFVRQYAAEFNGKDHFYAADTFNEMAPPPEEDAEVYLANYAKFVSGAIREFDSAGIWVLQGWMFRNESYWTRRRAQAMLSNIDPGGAIILDLTAAAGGAQYDRLDGFFGQPFVYVMLHNYGGSAGIYAKLSTIASAPKLARERFRNAQSMLKL